MAVSAAPVSGAPSYGVGSKQAIRNTISKLIDQYFKSTLGSEQGIVDYIMAMAQKESSLNPATPSGQLVSDLSNARAADYMKSSAVKALDNISTPLQRRYIQDGKRAHGILQVMGWNIVRGGSAKTQKCEFQELGRSDIAERFLVNAGDDIASKLAGVENLENGLLAGMAILESKWKRCRQVSGGWSAGGVTYTSRLACAVGAYLGVVQPGSSKEDEVNAYVSNIMGGKSYQIANGSLSGSQSRVVTASSTQQGPTTDGSGQRGEVVGC